MAAGKSSDQVITTSVQSIMGSSSTPSGLALTHSIYPLPPAPNTWDHQIHLHFPIFSRILYLKYYPLDQMQLTGGTMDFV